MNPKVNHIGHSHNGLAENHAIFERFVSHSEHFLRNSEIATAATYCQIAAECAWRNHPGLFSSLRLESVLQQVARRSPMLVGTSRRVPRENRPIRRVLHVMTQAYPTGGHTRFAWRWMEKDSSRVHSLVLTRQGIHRVPLALWQASKHSGGDVSRIDCRAGDLITRAAALRRMSCDYDAIVLHVHPYDVVPVIALSNWADRPPIIFLNHTDHAFWLGVSISDIVTHFRHSGERLSVNRRAIEQDRCTILPIPIGPADRALSKAAAKEKLKLSERNIVLLSIAAAYKYKGHNGPNFMDSTVPILEKNKNAVLLIVGPAAKDLTVKAPPEIANRIRIYGWREDSLIFYQAADIFLDSFPLPSITSLLEAGSFGVPLVSYCANPPSSEVLCADSPGLMHSLIRAVSIVAYQNAVTDLINRPEGRSDLGCRTREEIEVMHKMQWPEHLANLYARAMSITPQRIWQPPTDKMVQGELDNRLARFHCEGGFSQSAYSILRSHYRLLPFKYRFKIWLAAGKKFTDWIPDFFLPDWLFTQLKSFIFSIWKSGKT